MRRAVHGQWAGSLFEGACGVWEVGVGHVGVGACAADLTTVAADDLLAAYREISGG